MENAQQVITIVLGIGGIISGAFALFTFLTKTNVKQDKELALMDTRVKDNKNCITKVELKVGKIDEKVEKILTNHLPHIEKELVGLKGSIDRLSDKIK